MKWIYVWDPCVGLPSRGGGPLHKMQPFPDGELPDDRLPMMYCTSCDAHTWGFHTIKEEPW